MGAEHFWSLAYFYLPKLCRICRQLYSSSLKLVPVSCQCWHPTHPSLTMVVLWLSSNVKVVYWKTIGFLGNVCAPTPESHFYIHGPIAYIETCSMFSAWWWLIFFQICASDYFWWQSTPLWVQETWPWATKLCFQPWLFLSLWGQFWKR